MHFAYDKINQRLNYNLWPSPKNIVTVSVQAERTLCKIDISKRIQHFLSKMSSLNVNACLYTHGRGQRCSTVGFVCLLQQSKNTQTHIWPVCVTDERSLLPLALRPEADESVGKRDLWSVAALLSTISGVWLCCGSSLLTVSYPPPPSPRLSSLMWSGLIVACSTLAYLVNH